MWTRHWDMSGDPFLGPTVSYVPTATHDEAVARLVSTIEAGQRLAVVRGGAGLGKSVVLTRAIVKTRCPGRRIVRVARPADGPSLLGALAEGLGARAVIPAQRPAAWRALAEAVRVCAWQR